MRKCKRIAALILSLVFVLSLSSMVFAADDTTMEDGKSEGYGVIVTSKVDKEQYISGETATMTLVVENTNDYNLKNVNVQLLGSTQIKFESNTVKVGQLKAGEKKELTMKGVVTSNTEEPFGVLNGEYVGPGPIIGIIAGIAVAVLVVIIIIVVVVKKKKAKKAVASGMVAVLLAGSVFGSAMNVKAVSVHDPSIVKDPTTGTYYVFGSHLAWAKSTDLMSWENIQLNIDSDYDELFGDVWNNYSATMSNATLYSSSGSNLWAPDVIWNETMKKWCMYMSVNGNDWHSAIVLLTADNIEGPYEYADEVVFSGFWDTPYGNPTSNTLMGEKKLRVNSEDIVTKIKVGFAEESPYEDRIDYTDVKQVLGEDVNVFEYKNTDKNCVNAIDPVVTYDNEGNLWMTYGSWSAGIYQLKLDPATGLRDYTMTYEDIDNVSDDYLGYKIAGGFYNSGEGAYILPAGDYYYLFISYGNLEASGGYNMRVFRSESINGPYVDENGKSSILTSWDPSIGYKELAVTSKYNTTKGMKIFGSYSMYGVAQTQVAQGHNSAFVDEDGKIYVVYHTRFAGAGEGHEVRVHQMFINENGWLVAAPYAYSGETLSTTGYTADEIAGNYEFVFHDPKKVYVETATTVDKGVCQSENITLTADGKITGARTGTWKVTTGANVVLTIDGVDYSGVFLKQKTESTDEEVMTFTAAGANNTVWGVQPPK